MSVIEKINSIKQHITDAYAAVSNKQGKIPEDKNCENLAEAIREIPTGIDTSDTTATAGDVRSEKIFYASDGTKTVGTIEDYDNSLEGFDEILTNTNVTLSGANYDIGIAAVGDEIYLFGGYTGSSATNSIRVFDTKTNVITVLDVTISTARYGIGAAAVGDKIYLFGGKYTNIIQVFDTKTNEIETLDTTLSKEMGGMSAAVVGSKIYLLGGDNRGSTNIIQVFDTRTNEIETLSTTLTYAVENTGAAVVNSKIYVFGGSFSTIQVFDVETNTVEVLETRIPDNVRYGIGAAAVGDKIYLFGGSSNSVVGTISDYVNKIQIFDTKTDTIKDLDAVTLPNAEYGVSTAVVGNKIYLLGGYSSVYASLNTICIFLATNILITNKIINLKTKNMFCMENISVEPNLQSKTITTGGKTLPDDGYCGLSEVILNTEEVSVDLSMSDGDQVVSPSANEFLSKITVKKPSTLSSYNIRSGVNIGGVVGTYDPQPTLNAPTISLTDSTLKITNPASNGNFVTKFKVFSNGTALTEATIKGSTTNVDLSTLLTTGGTYTITAKASAANFNDSAASNSESYEVKTQTTPAISLVSGTTIQVDTIDDNATTIEVYADGTKIGEVAKQ